MSPWLLLLPVGLALAVLTGGSQEGAARAAVNAVLGLAALFAVNWAAPYTGIRLGFNLFNASIAGVLGVPGVVLLVLIQWVFT